MARILILHGPNLNLLGQREPKHYGHQTLQQIDQALQQQAIKLNHQLTIHQSNAEQALIELVHQSSQQFDFIIINPAAFTHTSIALRDAFIASTCPFIEVHLSNIYSREPFRQHSYFSDIAIGCISGLGPIVYQLALTAANNWLTINSEES